MSPTLPTASSFDGGDLAFGWRHSPAPPPVGHSDQEDRLQNAASELPPSVGINLVKVGVECVWSLKLPTHYLMGPGTSAWGVGGCLMEKGRRRGGLQNYGPRSQSLAPLPSGLNPESIHLQGHYPSPLPSALGIQLLQQDCHQQKKHFKVSHHIYWFLGGIRESLPASHPQGGVQPLAAAKRIRAR